MEPYKKTYERIAPRPPTYDVFMLEQAEENFYSVRRLQYLRKFRAMRDRRAEDGLPVLTVLEYCTKAGVTIFMMDWIKNQVAED